MTITDRQRTDLYRACEASMGKDPADTLMAMLPPVGWADVATKHDLNTLEMSLSKDISLSEQRLRTEIQTLRGDTERSLREQTRLFIFATAGLNATFLAAAVAIAQIFT